MEKFRLIIKYVKGMAVTIPLFYFCYCQPPAKKPSDMTTTKSIKGTLYNQQGKPVTDAVIMITGGSHSFMDIAAVSNERGEFFLDNLSVPGEYSIQVNWEGELFNKNIRLKETDTAFTLKL
jgi:Carboxypeptidase regulatory-like domain